MSNFSGGYLDIVAEDLHSLVMANQNQIQKETRMRILLQILALSENPAFRAALITALRSSNTFDQVKKELESPSFTISNFDPVQINKPATFTAPFNVEPQFRNETYLPDVATPTLGTSDVVYLKIGTTVMAKIVPPSTIATGADD